MRIFIAGATGAIGRPLVRQLTAGGHEVFAITRSEKKTADLRAAGANALVCDVFDRERLVPAVKEAAPDAIVHQLTDLPAAMEPRQLEQIYARNNRVRDEGTRNLLEAAKAAGVGRFVVQSMATWYRPEGGPIKTEADSLWFDAPQPIGGAVRTLADMERRVLEGVPHGIVLRYGAFYGPGTWYAADGDIAERVRSRSLPLIGDGDAVTSFIHVEDAASATVAALTSAGPGVYNVVDDEPARSADWLLAYADALGAPPPRRVPAFMARLVLGKALTAWLTTMRGASNAKIRAETKWRPKYVSWRQGLEELRTAASGARR